MENSANYRSTCAVKSNVTVCCMYENHSQVAIYSNCKYVNYLRDCTNVTIICHSHTLQSKDLMCVCANVIIKCYKKCRY